MAGSQQPGSTKSRRRASLDKGWAPLEPLKDGGYPFAPVDGREAEAIFGLEGGSRCGFTLSLLVLLRLKARGKDTVRVSDLEISWRARVSFNTVSKAAAELCRAGVVTVAHRQGALPEYRFVRPVADVGKARGKSSSRNGEQAGEASAAKLSRNGERFPTHAGTVPQKLSTRPPTIHHPPEKKLVGAGKLRKSPPDQAAEEELADLVRSVADRVEEMRPVDPEGADTIDELAGNEGGDVDSWRTLLELAGGTPSAEPENPEAGL